MPRQIITTANAPSSPLYSQAVKAGPHLVVSGIVGIDPGTGGLAGDTIQDQTRQALALNRQPLRPEAIFADMAWPGRSRAGGPSSSPAQTLRAGRAESAGA